MAYFDVDKRLDGSLPAFTGSVQPSNASGIFNVPSYQVSGVPLLQHYAGAQTNTNLAFETISRWVLVSANGGDVKLAFTQTGIADNNFLTIPSGEMSPRIEVMANGIFLTSAGACSVMAGLTPNILSGSYMDLDNYSNV
jgi:hypothetical protein